MLLYFGVAEHIACKEFYQSDIDTVAELLVCLCVFFVVSERIGETLQACALAGRKETLALAHDRCLRDSHQSREIRAGFDAQARRADLHDMLPQVGVLLVHAHLPFQFSLCAEKQGALFGFLQPSVDKLFVLFPEFVVFEDKIALPTGQSVPLSNHRVVLQFAETIRPNRETGEFCAMNTLYKLVPKVNPLDLLGFEQVFLQIGDFAFVQQDIIDTAGGDIAFVETEIGQAAYIVANAHNKDPFAMLGDADVMRAEDNRFGTDIVAYAYQGIVYHVPRVAMVVRGEVPNILEECVFRLVELQNTHYIKEKRAFGLVREAQTFARLGERLTGETGTQNIVRRNVFGINLSNIAFGLQSIVAGVCLAAIGIYIRRKDALTAQISHGLVETANAAKEVYKLEMFHFLSLFGIAKIVVFSEMCKWKIQRNDFNVLCTNKLFDLVRRQVDGVFVGEVGDDLGREEFSLRGDVVCGEVGGIGLEPAAEGGRADTCEKGELGFGVGFHCFWGYVNLLENM